MEDCFKFCGLLRKAELYFWCFYCTSNGSATLGRLRKRGCIWDLKRSFIVWNRVKYITILLWCDFSFFLLIRFAYFHKGTCRMIFLENIVNFMSIRFWSNYLPFELQLQKMFTLHFDMAHIFFLSFWKTVRKCWKNCALPVFFDNNNIKKKNRSRLFLVFLLRAWLWSLRVPLISIVQASKPTRKA